MTTILAEQQTAVTSLLLREETEHAPICGVLCECRCSEQSGADEHAHLEPSQMRKCVKTFFFFLFSFFFFFFSSSSFFFLRAAHWHLQACAERTLRVSRALRSTQSLASVIFGYYLRQTAMSAMDKMQALAHQVLSFVAAHSGSWPLVLAMALFLIVPVLLLTRSNGSGASSGSGGGRPSQSRFVLLTGPSGGGKTTLMSRLARGVVPATVPSSMEGRLTARLPSSAGGSAITRVAFVDVPGFPQFRERAVALAPSMAGVVFVVDAAAEYSPAAQGSHYKAAAECVAQRCLQVRVRGVQMPLHLSTPPLPPCPPSSSSSSASSSPASSSPCSSRSPAVAAASSSAPAAAAAPPPSSSSSSPPPQRLSLLCPGG